MIKTTGDITINMKHCITNTQRNSTQFSGVLGEGGLEKYPGLITRNYFIKTIENIRKGYQSVVDQRQSQA